MIKGFSCQFFTWMFCCIILCSACENRKSTFTDKFYRYSRSDAFRRLPLIKPFELINDGLGWSIETQYGINTSIRVDYILVDPGNKIMGYGDEGPLIIAHKDTVPGFIYFFIDLKNKRDGFSFDSVWFRHLMDSCSVSQKDFYTKKDLKKIFKDFDQKGILPWYRE
jgi:hypothetical protein